MLVTLGATTLRQRDGLPFEPIDVTFTVVEPPPPEPPPAATAAEPTAPQDVAPDAMPMAERRLRTRRRRRAKASKTPPSAKPSETSPAEVTVSPSTTKPAPNLDPETAVRAVFLSQESFPGETPEAPKTATASSEDRETPNYFEGVGKKRYLSQREPPKLRRHGDGTYRYRSHAFKAIVAKDGSVTFEDKNQQGMTVSFDLTDAMMRRRGEDPYRYEKEHFLKSTATFREELFERWKEVQTRLALKKLRVRLLRISEDVTLSQPQKEARVLAIFRNTADDEAGAAARKTIAEFVSRRMPGVELSSERSTR